MRVLSWNILHGGGGRREAILAAIAAIDPDLVTLQEVRRCEGRDPLLEGLADLGLGEQVLSPLGDARSNGVLIASRWPLSAEPLRPVDPSADPASPVYLMKARLSWPGRATGPAPGEGDGGAEWLNLVAVRFPQKQAQIAPFEVLLALPPSWRAELSLLIGDFNCGIPLFDSQTRTFPCQSQSLGCPDVEPLSCFTFLYGDCQTGFTRLSPMSTPLLLELFAGFLAAGIALWFVLLSRSAKPQEVVVRDPAFSLGGAADRSAALRRLASDYFLPEGPLANAALLLLRLAIGVMMIHHGQEKLADPQQFADTYVASLHLPFPLFFAYAAGFSELIGSWLLILGLLTPLGALAITGTMSVAAYQHILTAGLNIYVLELVVLYLGGSLALLLLGGGRISFDGAIVHELLEAPGDTPGDDQATSAFSPAYVTLPGDSRG